jgi:phytoene dehydrogenase-like protein
MTQQKTKDNTYDIIIIGSGLGALSTASIMAQLYDKRVLVLERHYVIGGFTHAFKRPDKSKGAGNKAKYEWDVGVHYIGGMAEGDRDRGLFDFITNSKLKWNRMAEPFEKFHYPGLDFDLYGDPERFRNDLVERFPEEEANIDGMFDDIKRVGAWTMGKMGAGNLPWPLSSLASLWNKRHEAFALQTTDEYLTKRFDDPKLRALVISQWGCYGVPPKRSPFHMQAGIINHYLKGGYYPEGGAMEMAQTVMPVVEAKGGAFLINHQVNEIIVERGRAVGVEVVSRKGGSDVTEQFYAPAIVSNVGAYNTYAKLLPGDIGAKKAKIYEKFLSSSTGVTVYLGLNESAKTLGFQGENHWMYKSFDHDANANGEDVINGTPQFCYLSFPSLKNSEASTHTAEILSFVDYKDFEKWAGDDWKKRGEDYEELKDTIAKGLIALVDEHYPGFADLIEYVEVSTPVTTEHFTDHPKGAIYGLEASPERFKEIPFGARTPVKGLYLTGADTFSVGIVPALISGMMTSGAIVGKFGFFKVAKDLKNLARAARA